jgi:hypothetical protein
LQFFFALFIVFAPVQLSPFATRPPSGRGGGGGDTNQNLSQDSPNNGLKWEGSIDSGYLAHPI